MICFLKFKYWFFRLLSIFKEKKFFDSSHIEHIFNMPSDFITLLGNRIEIPRLDSSSLDEKIFLRRFNYALEYILNLWFFQQVVLLVFEVFTLDTWMTWFDQLHEYFDLTRRLGCGFFYWPMIRCLLPTTLELSFRRMICFEIFQFFLWLFYCAYSALRLCILHILSRRLAMITQFN